ncbi:acetyltransferase (GNAT) family domain-containing protein [Cordyceps javanica]|uniref:Acetyltransferase (GNAT) family domain-containing protein n=1 Tax=Cordyceps javanica TaxID=43265 RepID=A0A545UV03_9HYPO|nr:acetyltransferase (GNAT) family domain-containing protein [Cordyceps javanica]
MTSMQEMTDSFRNIFKSQRLVYTALEQTDRCRDFWWRCRASNLVNRSLIGPEQPTPPSRAESDKQLEQTVDGGRKPYLAVLVCLPAPTTADAAAGDQGTGKSEAEAEPEPEPVGFLVLNKSFPECAAYHVGFLEEHQNKGYGREAIGWAADYAFRWCNMHRLSIGALAYNERALHLYASMGFVQDSRMRSCFYINGSWHDLVEFSMLREEWEKLRDVSA